MTYTSYLHEHVQLLKAPIYPVLTLAEIPKAVVCTTPRSKTETSVLQDKRDKIGESLCFRTGYRLADIS